MSGVRRLKYARGGGLSHNQGEQDTEGRHLRDKMRGGEYYGTTSGDAVRQIHHFRSEGDYDPYTPMSGPKAGQKRDEPDEPSAKYARGGKARGKKR